jgi:restriction endonuclease Mrr
VAGVGLRNGNNVGRPEVQAFVGSLVGLGATKGVFVTTSAFSSQALDFVRRLSQRVILIDGQRLADLLIEHNVGVLDQRFRSLNHIRPPCRACGSRCERRALD